jgi:Domain of unknown function (DUF4760)
VGSVRDAGYHRNSTIDGRWNRSILCLDFFLIQQMKESRKQQSAEYRWNRCKASQEVLVSMITGEFPSLMDALSTRFGWGILSHEPYLSAISRLDEKQALELDITLRNVFRHLEVICINMKHGIIEEEMCYDYLKSILITFYSSCKPFLDKEREMRQEPEVFIEFQQYAGQWIARAAIAPSASTIVSQPIAIGVSSHQPVAS